MARGSDINQRLVLTGNEEFRKQLEINTAAGQRMGNQIRAALIAATQGASSFTSGARNAAASSGQMRFALQNLSFQVNDVATSLASGGDVMRVFAQQGGQIFQAFQQGGGLGNVLSAAAAGARSMITPTTAAVAGLAALAAGFGFVIARAVSSEDAARQFDVILKGVSRTSQTTGKDLEAAAHRLHDVGISAAEARESFAQFAREGGKGNAENFERIVRIGANLNTVLGEGSLQRFVSAAAKGGEPLREFAKQLGIVPGIAEDTSKQLEAAAASSAKFNDSVADLLRNRGRAIADEQRSRRQQIGDLTRRRGTPEEEIVFASERRIQEITRDSTTQLLDLQRQRADELSKQRAAELAAYNKQVQDAAQAALDTGKGLIAQIEAAVTGANQAALNPLQQAIRNLSTEWDKLVQTMVNSPAIQSLVNGFGSVITAIRDAINWIDQLRQAINNIPGLPSWLGGGGAGISPLAFAPFRGLLNMAEGGPVRGPGGPTADRVPIWGSNGEFMMAAAAVRHWGLPMMEAMNSIRAPAMPQRRMPRGFSGGGLVAAGGAGGGSSIFITFPDGSRAGPMRADRDVENALVRRARRSGMLSAGRKPSTA